MKRLALVCAFALLGCSSSSDDDGKKAGTGGSVGTGGSGTGGSGTGGSGTGGSSTGGAGGSGGGNPQPPPTSCTDAACAFPGAEGFGTDTPGGRGGQVIVVTTLDPTGPGSFAEAMLTPGKRIVVFQVSGVIDYGGASIDLMEEHSEVTVLGQTSPGGITLKNVTLSSYHQNLHDVVLRFLRIRGPEAYDNISFAEASKVVIDHCDFSGGSDEAFDITYGHDFTVQWSTITNSTAGDGSQNYGALIAYAPTTRISWHHNLSVNHGGRCGAQMHWAGDMEQPPNGAELDWTNNVFHNCGFQQLLRADEPPPAGLKANLVGNFAKSGPNTQAESMMFGLDGDLYMVDNTYEGQTLILTPYATPNLLDAAHAFPPITTTSAQQAYTDVLAWSGSWPRDAMATRTVDEVKQGTGQLGKTDDPLNTASPEPPADGDLDGLPDEWESAHGTNPNDASDSAKLDASGYSNIEVYANQLALDIIGK
jgi:pectate lyase